MLSINGLTTSLLRKFGVSQEDIDFNLMRLRGQPYFWSEYPMTVQIDTNNFCGQKYSNIGPCVYCQPQDEVMRGVCKYVEMPFEYIEWIQKDIAKNMPRLYRGGFPPVQFVADFLRGDCQNELRLHEILKMQKQVAPWLPTQVFTCASKPENMGLFNDKNLDWVCVTLSAHTPEIYRQVHHGDRFEYVLKSLDYLSDHAPSSQWLEVHYVVNKFNFAYIKDWYDFIGERYPRFRRIISPLVQSPTNKPSRFAMGDLSLEMQEQAIAKATGAGFWSHESTGLKQPCVLWGNFSVTSEGYVLQCCNWAEQTLFNYGNIRDYISEGRSLKDAWLERLANKQNNILCRGCNLKHPNYRERLKGFEPKVKFVKAEEIWMPKHRYIDPLDGSYDFAKQNRDMERF
jgi:hypothetical protein